MIGFKAESVGWAALAKSMNPRSTSVPMSFRRLTTIQNHSNPELRLRALAAAPPAIVGGF